jgi:hypothetical protein
LVGKVWVEGNDECLEQLKAGLAWHYKEYEKEQSPTDRQVYANSEQEARAQKRGLWKDSAPTPPWQYRHHANGSTAESDQPDEPALSSRNFSNGAPSVDHHPTNAATPIANPSSDAGTAGLLRGNKRTMIYHWPGCPNYDDIVPHNRVPFETREEAEKAGYRAARNCN